MGIFTLFGSAAMGKNRGKHKSEGYNSLPGRTPRKHKTKAWKIGCLLCINEKKSEVQPAIDKITVQIDRINQARAKALETLETKKGDTLDLSDEAAAEKTLLNLASQGGGGGFVNGAKKFWKNIVGSRR